jgi:hypothetical protein
VEYLEEVTGPTTGAAWQRLQRRLSPVGESITTKPAPKKRNRTRKQLAPLLRDILRQHPDGLTASQIIEILGDNTPSSTIHTSLHNMPDAYIDRWNLQNPRGRYSAIWCVVDVPQNCPRPIKEKKVAEKQHADLFSCWNKK